MPEIELKGDPEDFKAMEPLGNAPVAPAHGIAAIRSSKMGGDAK